MIMSPNFNISLQVGPKGGGGGTENAYSKKNFGTSKTCASGGARFLVPEGRPGLVSGAHTGSSRRLKNLENHGRSVRNQILRIEKKGMQATGVKKVPSRFHCLNRRARHIRTPASGVHGER